MGDFCRRNPTICFLDDFDNLFDDEKDISKAISELRNIMKQKRERVRAKNVQQHDNESEEAKFPKVHGHEVKSETTNFGQNEFQNQLEIEKVAADFEDSNVKKYNREVSLDPFKNELWHSLVGDTAGTKERITNKGSSAVDIVDFILSGIDKERL